jgi:hypothetical protein
MTFSTGIRAGGLRGLLLLVGLLVGLKVGPLGADAGAEFVGGWRAETDRYRARLRGGPAGSEGDVDHRGKHDPGEERGGKAPPQPGGGMGWSGVAEILPGFGHLLGDAIRLKPCPFLVYGCLVDARGRGPGLARKARGRGGGSW